MIIEYDYFDKTILTVSKDKQVFHKQIETVNQLDT